MSTTSTKGVRQSISLPGPVAKRVRALAKSRHTSANRILVDLIETGMKAKEREREEFLALVDRLQTATDPAEREELKEVVARMTFGF